MDALADKRTSAAQIRANRIYDSDRATPGAQAAARVPDVREETREVVMSNETKYQVGDEVSWTSSAAGTTKAKRGKVVAVVPSNTHCSLRDLLGETWTRRFRLMMDTIYPYGRSHESYIVEVSGSTPNQLPVIYWPRVSQLRKVSE
jgi:hypothetical protein